MIRTSLNKVRIMDKLKEMQSTLQKLKASLQSIKNKAQGNPPQSPQ